MTDDLGRGRYEVDLDNAAAKAKVQETEQAIAKAGDTVESAFGGKATGALSKFGGELKAGVMQGFGLAGGLQVANLAAGAIQGTIDKLGNSIDLASDKAEAGSKVNVLFGQSAHLIEEASKGAADAVGLSSGAYLSAAGDLGNLLTNFGITGDAAAGMSNDMIKLAADVGSFNNADPTEVVAAMGAAFRGEAEPIRRFGVMLDDAAVKAKAVELGLYAGTGALDKNARAQAVYSLILEQTSKAQGDFARTADGLANAQRISAAKQEEAWTRLGEKLAPIASTIVPMVADAMTLVVDALGKVFDLASAILGPLFELGGVIVDVAGGFLEWGASLPFVKDALDAIVGAVKIVSDAVGELVGFLAAGADAVSESFDEMTGRTDDAIAASRESMADLANFPGKVADDLAAGAPAVAAGAKEGIADPIAAGIDKGRKEAVAIARKTPMEIAKALADATFHVDEAMEGINAVVEDAMTEQAEIASIKAFLTGDAMANGLRDKRASVRAIWQAYKSDAEERLFALQHNVDDIAADTGQDYADVLKGKRGEVSEAARVVIAGARGRMTALRSEAGGYASATGQSYASNLAGSLSRNQYLVRNALAGYQRLLYAASPPGPESPLHEIDKWGDRTGSEWSIRTAGGIAAGRGEIRAQLSGVAADIAGTAVTPGLVAPASGYAGASGLIPPGLGGSIDHSGQITIIVRDPDGGLARAGIDTHELSRELGQHVRLQLIRSPATFTRPAGT
jgi:hypothetical protein